MTTAVMRGSSLGQGTASVGLTRPVSRAATRIPRGARSVVVAASPREVGEEGSPKAKGGVAGNFGNLLKSNIEKTIEYERDRLVGEMDSLIDTSSIKIQKNIKSVSKEENSLLNAWTGTGFSVAGGAAVVGLLILFIFVIGPPPQHA